jgi:hypothetical protein
MAATRIGTARRSRNRDLFSLLTAHNVLPITFLIG